MLKLLMTDGICYPLFVCDHCGRVIEGAQEGNYEWRPQHGIPDPEICDLRFIHKRCSHAYEVATGWHSWWGDLEDLVFYLGNSVEVDWSALADRYAAISDEIRAEDAKLARRL